jgi:signal transduction histidine kinase
MRRFGRRPPACPSLDSGATSFWHRKILSRFPRHHLYLQIYASFVMVLVVFTLFIAAVLWDVAARKVQRANGHLVVLMEKVLPVDASPASTRETLEALAGITHADIALYAADGRLLASVGKTPPAIPRLSEDEGPIPFNAGVFQDGRRLALDWHANHDRPPLPLGWLAAIALLAALGAYPIVRRLTRRIEALQRQADALGQGNLAARVEVRGCDEIAELARRFNQAAERIEALVNSQRAMLASASHELRSPLTRIRMATSLIGDERPDLQDQITRDIAELDALIGDLLLASRLSTDTPTLRPQSVDLLGLAAEEARRSGASLCGDPVELRGDARLLRHMLRNLLENARRHAAGTAIDIELKRDGPAILLRVRDGGPGVPDAEREKIFEPFYRPPGTAETGEGVGYGLALVRRIARLHGGDVRCLPREGTGACFEVTLPADA